MKKLKELFNKYHNKLSVLVVILYFLVPLAMMFINYKTGYCKNLDIWYNITFVFGCISAIIGFLNLVINIKKISIKTMLPFILISILLLICFIASWTSEYRDLALNGEHYRHMGYYTYLLLCGFYINAINIEKKDYKLVGTVLAIVSTIISVVALMNNSFTYKVFIKNKLPYNGIFMNTNHFGYYLSISVIVMIFLTLYEKNIIKRLCYYLMMSISIVTLIANDTFGSYLGVLIALIFLSIYSLIKKKNIRLLYIVLLFVCLSFIVSNTNGSFVKNNFNSLFFDAKILRESDDESFIDTIGTSRMKLWKYTYKLVKKKPLLGVGPNVVSKYYEQDGIRKGVPHNFLLEVASYNGIPALIIYLILLGYLFIRNLIKSNEYNIVLLVCMISYLISAFFGNMFFNTSPYFAIVLGMLSSSVILEEKIKNNKTTRKKKILKST